MRLVALLANDLERPMLHVRDETIVVHLATNKTLSIEHGIDRIHGSLVLCGITDQALGLSERNTRRGGAVSMVVRNYLDTIVLHDADTRICSSQIDTNGGPINFLKDA